MVAVVWKLPREHPVARTHRQENTERGAMIREDIVNTSNSIKVKKAG
jgi:hypothetical protein